MDLEAARNAMVDSQVRTNDVTDRRLITAMLAVPREAFVPAGQHVIAYADRSVETGPGRHLIAAREFSKLVMAAAILDEDRVLDVAPGAGYSSVVLARIAKTVVALEQDEAAARGLRDSLAKHDALGVEIVAGPLKAGAPDKGPFNVILVNGSVEEVPDAWLSQLAEGGRLGVVVKEGGIRRARIYTRSGGKTAWRAPFDSASPALPGFERAQTFQF